MRNVAVASVGEADAEVLEARIEVHGVVVCEKPWDWNLMPSFGESVTVAENLVAIEVIWENDVPNCGACAVDTWCKVTALTSK